jgi:hypothetical protein
MALDDSSSRTELDSHANMVVVGKHCSIVEWTGRTAIVNPFTPDYDALTQVPIVDAALVYECPFSGREYILLVRNALHVPAMENNLIPPFIMREAGITVNDTPKIQLPEPTVDDHAIIFEEGTFKIPLALWGIFSYFPTSVPSNDQLEACDDVYLLTPNGQWNPHSDSYSKNEENMLDWEGNLVEKKYRKEILLSEVEEDLAMASSATISTMEHTMVDTMMPEAFVSSVSNCPSSEVSPIYDPDRLYSLLNERAQESRFMMSVGSTNVCASQHLIEDETESSDDDNESQEPLTDDDDEAMRDYLASMDSPLGTDIDLDDYMISASHTRMT